MRAAAGPNVSSWLCVDDVRGNRGSGYATALWRQ